MLRFDLFPQGLKLPLLLSFLFFLTKNALTSATRSPYSSDPACVSSPHVTALSISSQKNSDRAASVPPSILPSSIVVNSLIMVLLTL